MLGPSDKADLKSVSEFNSTWADRVAYLILAGLLVDILDLFMSEGWAKIAAAIGANLLIFGGVWGELWFAKRAREADDGRVAEAHASAARASAQAAEANLAAETERLARAKLEASLAPRILDREKQQAVVAKIAPFSGQKAGITCSSPTQEAELLTREIAAALEMAGWQTQLVPPLGFPLWPGGVLVAFTDDPKSSAASGALSQALNSQEIFCRAAPLLVLPDWAQMPAFRDDPTRVFVTVGEKPIAGILSPKDDPPARDLSI